MNSSSPISVTPNSVIPVVALAILHQDGHFLMQLRDDIPTILYPGHWGFFGGHLEPNETPEEGVKREIWEEINYNLQNPTIFDCYADERAIRHIFHAPLTVPLEQLILQEGADLELVPPQDIEKGQCYSGKLDKVRPLGAIHQKILLDFLNSH
ncbi:NUDIX hydrolase [Crocosphaera sp. XPORK-15E]|uniref:NUDIX hydrolase n=1 Tax=Crocosphaera sp. XPORK-15E TaxID=3110247 RepID=UPI002B21EE89|nr:NUDIX hydrolase [Crocosphaera sp. XPORK-15E]MEA5533846.1 NUDIX hydrolase [Crocosphaera sp. XPORK-15E]